MRPSEMPPLPDELPESRAAYEKWSVEKGYYLDYGGAYGWDCWQAALRYGEMVRARSAQNCFPPIHEKTQQ